MNPALIIQIIEFLISHDSEIVKLIQVLEQASVSVVTDLSGPEKGDVIKGWIAVQNNIVADIDPLWEIVGPIFNKKVASVKAALQK